VVAVAVCAVLAGARSYAAIAQWGGDLDGEARHRLGLGSRAPDGVTIWRVLTAVDPVGLDAAIGAWVGARLRCRRRGWTRYRRVLAVDGKTLRGARDHGDPQDRAPHLMACLDHDAGVVLAQVAVDGKTNEIAMFTTLLDQIEDLDGVLVTADALHAQREHATYLHGRGAHYVITVKRNQPSLHAQLKALPWQDVPVGHASTDRAHGRLEKRTVKAVTVTQQAGGLLFPHAAQAIQIVRHRRRLAGGRWRRETVYAITSLPAEHAQPAQLAGWIRSHWKIENQLHWVRDVTFAEDASQARTGAGPHVMASLRNLAISVHRLAGETNIAAALRRTARRPERLIEMITRKEITTLQ
jgi:predicted transposase YbfD/YdcC